MPTAQASPRALKACRNSAPMPYPASARTVPKRTPAAIRRSSSVSAISDLAHAGRYSTGTPARSSRAGLRQEQPQAHHHWDLAARKSVGPMAERVAPGDYDRLHHFVSDGVWDEAPLERELATQADKLVGGADAFLVIDDTALPKKGTHSVGVAPQYASAL